MPSLPTLWLAFWLVSRLLPFPPLSVIYQIFKGITKPEWRQNSHRNYLRTWEKGSKVHGDKFKELSLGHVSKCWDMSQLQHTGTTTRVRYWGISWSAHENKSFYQDSLTQLQLYVPALAAVK